MLFTVTERAAAWFQEYTAQVFRRESAIPRIYAYTLISKRSRIRHQSSHHDTMRLEQIVNGIGAQAPIADHRRERHSEPPKPPAEEPAHACH